MKVTASTTTAIPAEDNDGREYPVVAERLVRIEGVDFVRCPTHGLIPLLHECSKSPGDHWCRTAAHPAYDPATGEDGLDDQACSHRDWDRFQSARFHALYRLHDADDAGICQECRRQWPCRTRHLAAAWGDRTACEEAGWCHHARVAVNAEG